MIKMGTNRVYWKIEFLTKKENCAVACFSPKFYGSFIDCKKWVNNQDFLNFYRNSTKLYERITLQV